MATVASIRFLSLVHLQTPEALVTAIQAGKVGKSDARPFCNQLAWLLSGKDVKYTAIQEVEEAKRYSAPLHKIVFGQARQVRNPTASSVQLTVVKHALFPLRLSVRTCSSWVYVSLSSATIVILFNLLASGEGDLQTLYGL